MVNKVLQFTWDEWKWLAIIVMLGFVMYWTALVVEPTYTIIKEIQETQQAITERGKSALNNSRQIMDTVNNNTEKLTSILMSGDEIRLAHNKTTNALLLLQLRANQTTNEISTITNEILTLEKAEQETRKDLGELLTVLVLNNNLTVPEDLRKALLFEEASPEKAAPN